MLPPAIIDKIEKTFGRNIRYSSDVEELCYRIESVTGRSVSVNTLKRLFGIVKDVKEPRLYTLDTIANFLDCKTWDELLNKERGSNSDFSLNNEIKIDSLKEGERVFFAYPPDREVTCEYMGKGNLFTVVESKNGKLRVGDVIVVNHFLPNYPLIIDNVVRDGVALGQFTAGKYSGLSECRKVEKI